MRHDEIVTDAAIKDAFKGTSFGDSLPRNLVNEGLMKRVCGYHNGFTLDLILVGLGLTTKRAGRLTAKGRSYFWELFKGSDFR